MRHFKALVGLALILTLIFTSGLAAPASGAAPSGLLILGDSISTGYGLPDPAAGCYGAKLAAALELTGAQYKNLAVDGATSADLAAALKAPSMAQTLASYDAVVLSIGGNDLLGQLFSLAKQALGLSANASNLELQKALEENPNALMLVGAALLKNQEGLMGAADAFSGNLNDVVRSINAANPEARLYIQTVYNPFGGVEELALYAVAADMIITRMNDVILAGSADGGYTVVDIYAAFKDRAPRYTNIAVFDIHPNAAGHTLIFEKVYAAMPDTAPRSPSSPSTGDGFNGFAVFLLALSLMGVTAAALSLSASRARTTKPNPPPSR